MNEAERDALRFSSLEGLRPLVCSRPAVAYRTDAVFAISFSFTFRSIISKATYGAGVPKG